MISVVANTNLGEGMKKIAGLLLVLSVALILLSSCMTPTFEWVPQRIAILPFSNESADVAVQQFARVYLYDRISRMNKHQLVPLDQVDAALNDLGITEGGQLPTVTVQEISEKIGADGIIYGNVITAKHVMLGVYYNKEFACRYSMLRGSDGEVFWDETEEESEKKIVLNPKDIIATAATQMVKEVATDAILKAMRSHPLYQQIEKVTTKVVWTLPR